MSADQQICPICQQPKQAGKAGSLTQWISTCQCGLSSPEPESDKYSPDWCRRCGKRVSSGRSGSLTQWILRSDLCACDFPALDESQQSAVPPAESEPVQSPAPEVYLELDEDILPTERYRPIEQLGRGVAGSVYLCRDTLLNKQVAIKSMKSLASDLLISFQNEARILSRLNHPYIIKVLDFGATASGAPFMVMEYFKGVSLEKFLDEKGGRMPVSLAIDWTAKILDALSEAHRNGIFHRDLKPSNILVESIEADTTIKSIRLIDFGVAHISSVSGEVAIYEGQKVIGTPRYMSPDQVLTGNYDSRSEIYSVGCILFELLTGRPPFSGDSAIDILYKQANQYAPSLQEVTATNNSDFPEALETVLARCLTMNPDNRYSSAEALKRALAEISPAQECASIFSPDRKRVGRASFLFPSLFILLLIAGCVFIYVQLLATTDSRRSVAEQMPTPKVESASEVRQTREKESGELRQMFSTDNLSSGRPDTLMFTGPDAMESFRAAVANKQERICHILMLKSDLTDTDMEALVVENPWTITVSDSPRLTDRSLALISKLERLDRLTLDQSPGFTPGGLKELGRMKRLEFLALRRCNLQDEALKAIQEIKPLVKLNISGNKAITARGIKYLAGRPRLLTVVAEGCTCAYIPSVARRRLLKQDGIELIDVDDDNFDLFGLGQ